MKRLSIGFWSLSLTTIILIVFYIIFVQSSIFNLLTVRQLERDTTMLASNLGVLEYQFLDLARNLSYDSAIASGYVPIASESYVNSHEGREVTYLGGQAR